MFRKLIVQLVHKFPELYVKRRFITVFTTASQLSPPSSPQAQLILSMPSLPILLRSTLINARIFQVVALYRFSHQNPPLPHSCYVPKSSVAHVSVLCLHTSCTDGSRPTFPESLQTDPEGLL